MFGRAHVRFGHSRRFWHVRVMSGWGVISEMPGVRFLPVEGIGPDPIQAPNRSLESCGMNSRILNGLPSGRSFPNEPRGGQQSPGYGPLARGPDEQDSRGGG